MYNVTVREGCYATSRTELPAHPPERCVIFMPETRSPEEPSEEPSRVMTSRRIFAFAHIEKCAGTSVITVLRSLYGPAHVDVIPLDKNAMTFGQGDLDRTLRIVPFARSIAGHSIRPFIDYDTPEGVELVFYTVLRSPVDRYISDFFHFVDLLGFPADFEKWLDFEERSNFITRSIAGTVDLDRAKELLDSKIQVVGTVEYYDRFLSDLATEMGQPRLSQIRVFANRAEKRPDSIRSRFDKNKHLKQILDRNSVDLALYDYANDKIRLRQAESRDSDAKQETSGLGTRDKCRLLLNRGYRSVIYKPLMGYAPFMPHALPMYRGYSD